MAIWAGAFRRSLGLGVMSLADHGGVSVCLPAWPSAGGSGAPDRCSTCRIISLVVPGILLGLGISQLFQLLGFRLQWWLSGLGAHLSWTLPFGLLIMFAVLNRFDGVVGGSRPRCRGAAPGRCCGWVTMPILFPGLIAVALFGFTLSYDEIAALALDRGRQEHPSDRNLEHDDQRHHAGALCHWHGDLADQLRS